MLTKLRGLTSLLCCGLLALVIAVAWPSLGVGLGDTDPPCGGNHEGGGGTSPPPPPPPPPPLVCGKACGYENVGTEQEPDLRLKCVPPSTPLGWRNCQVSNDGLTCTVGEQYEECNIA